MKPIRALVIILLITTSCCAQDDFKQLFLHSDSIIIIHHKEPIRLKPKGYPDTVVVDDSIKKYSELIIDNSFNNNLVISKLALNKQQHAELVSIINGTYSDSIITSPCWRPKHTIEIYLNGKKSYFTICFECYYARFIDGNHAPMEILPKEMWAALKAYLIKYRIFE